MILVATRISILCLICVAIFYIVKAEAMAKIAARHWEILMKILGFNAKIQTTQKAKNVILAWNITILIFGIVVLILLR